MPLVTVIMPAYNASKTIEDAIFSVLQQTFRDFELIVVDDCSVDDTFEKITYLARKDHRIRPFRNKVNSGVSYTRNFAISLAEGEWVAFLDSDDMWVKEKLEKQIKVCENNTDCDLVYTASSFIDYQGNPYEYIMPAIEKTTYEILLKKNLLSCSSVLVKTDLIKSVKMSSDDMHEDYAAWLLILKKIKYAHGINEPLLIYRLSLNSKSSNRFKSAKMTYNTYLYVGYNSMISFLLMLRYSLHSISKRYKIKNRRH